MEQAQIRVRFSVGTKLLLSILLLLIIVIGFLDVSTILILSDDKRAYTYQTQANETLLAGREFTSLVQRSLDTLRISLASVDPTQPITPRETAQLGAILNNQSEILAVAITLIDTATGESRELATGRLEQKLEALKLNPDHLRLTREWIKVGLPELKSKGFTLINISRLGAPPLMAVVLADLKLVNLQGGMPVAIGVVSTQEFANALPGGDLTIASPEGWVLYSTDGEALFTRRNISDDPLYVRAKSSVVARGANEYDWNGTRHLGSYFNLNSGAMVLSRTTWQRAMQATAALTEKFILLALMAIGAAIVYAILFAKSLSAPLARLYEATKHIAAGNFSVQLMIGRRHDEIGALSSSFNFMSAKIAQLIQETAANARIESELAIASTVQQTLIPPDKFNHPKIYIRSHYQSASECGGDWWGFFGVGDKFVIMIADATGHGIPSALITAAARSCISVLNKLAQEDSDFAFSPSGMLSYANRVIFDASGGRIMMTFWMGVVDFKSMTLTYSSAGHNPPWHLRMNGDKVKLTSLVSKGSRAGEGRDSPDYAEKTVDLRPGDILFLYTDGLMEGTNAEKVMYGKKRSREVVEQSTPGGPDAIVDSLMADFLRHNGSKALDDDVTLAVAQIRAPGGS